MYWEVSKWSNELDFDSNVNSSWVRIPPSLQFMEYVMCKKIEYKVECLKCGYPACDARYLDSDPPLQCNTSNKKLKEHILKQTIK